MLALLLLLPAGAAWAHPLGNFTTNTYAGLLVTPDEVRIDYVLDLAEVPAFQTIRDFDLDGDGVLDGADGSAYRSQRCDELAAGLSLLVDGTPTTLLIAASELSLPPGEAGLVTLRLECTLVAAHAAGEDPVTVAFSDTNADGRVGWREITADGAGMRISDADVAATSLSGRLVDYPEELLASPLDERAAQLVATPDGSAAPAPIAETAAQPGVVGRGLQQVDRWFTGLVAVQELTVGFVLLATLAALGLGAMHSLAPGHGKTVMAAYVVGREGSNRQALQLAITVAVTHTLGVLILGVVLSATQTLAPEQLYPYLGLASGLLFAAVGTLLLRRALRGRHDHDHDHGHDHGLEPAAIPVLAGAGAAEEVAQSHTHDTRHADHRDHHGQHAHGGHSHTHELPEGGLTWKSLIAPGLAGGLVPSPSALLVLLGGIALGRAWFGVGLVIAYGIGMAGTLVGAGYLLLRARRTIERRADVRGWSPAARISRVLPVATSGVILLVGLGLAVVSGLQI
jgi:ABC-type nickel/cobalt efflux system permease component RcnA